MRTKPFLLIITPEPWPLSLSGLTPCSPSNVLARTKPNERNSESSTLGFILKEIDNDGTLCGGDYCRIMSRGPIHEVIERWHQHVRGNLPGGLDELLHEEVVFYSPVVFTPQRGKEITMLYLNAASQALPGDASDFSAASAWALCVCLFYFFLIFMPFVASSRHRPAGPGVAG